MTGVSFADLKDWLAVINIIATAMVGLFVWIIGQDKATNDRISQLEDGMDARLDDSDRRITKLEGKVDSSPTHEDLRGLRRDMERQGEKLDQLLGESRAYTRSLSRIEQYLLDSKP